MLIKVVFIALLAVVASSCSQQEVDASIIQDRNGTIYVPNESSPFSGIATSSYPNQQQELVNEYSEGKLNGVQRSWYENGQLRTEQDFLLGAEIGSSTEWYEDGQLKSKRLTGSEEVVHFQYWNQDGILVSEINLSGNSLVGENVWDPPGEWYRELTVDAQSGDAVMVYRGYSYYQEDWVTENDEYNAGILVRSERSSDTEYSLQEWEVSEDGNFMLTFYESEYDNENERTRTYLDGETNQLVRAVYEGGELVSERITGATWHLTANTPTKFIADGAYFYIETEGTSESLSLSQGWYEGLLVDVGKDEGNINVFQLAKDEFHGWNSFYSSDGIAEGDFDCFIHDDFESDLAICEKEFGAEPKLSDLNIDERLRRISYTQ
jgi:hypothetical protein